MPPIDEQEVENQDLETSSEGTSGEQPENDAAESAADEAEGAEGTEEASEEAEEGAGEAEEGAEEGEAEGDDAEGEPPATSAGAAGDWAPDAARFKVDGKELPYDEKIAGILTKENEPIIRELVEKAYGIEAIKGRHEEVKAERDTLRGQLVSTVGQVREILAFRDAGDFDSFLEACNIPFDTLAVWMHNKLKTQASLPPEARGVYDEASRLRREHRTSNKQVEEMGSQLEDAMAQVGAMKLDMALADQAVRDVAAEYDARMGEPGSFRKAVIQHAAAHEMTTRQSIEPAQAIQSFLKVIGRTPGQGKSAAPPPKAKPKVVAHKPQTIPNVGASAKSPAKPKVRNLADLRRIAKEKGA